MEKPKNLTKRSLFASAISILIFLKGFISINVEMETLTPNLKLVAQAINYSFLVVALLITVYWAYKEVMWRIDEFFGNQKDDLEMIRFINDYRKEHVKNNSGILLEGGISISPKFFDNSRIETPKGQIGSISINECQNYPDTYAEIERKSAETYFVHIRNKRFTEAKEIVNRYYECN